MKRHQQLWLCTVCNTIKIVRLRLTDKKPRCCGQAMKKILAQQPPGRTKR